MRLLFLAASFSFSGGVKLVTPVVAVEVIHIHIGHPWHALDDGDHFAEDGILAQLPALVAEFVE